MTAASNASPATGRHATIAAIATPPGFGGVGILRLSGPEARQVLGRVFRPSSSAFIDFTPRLLHHGHLLEASVAADDDAHEPAVLDEVLAVFMPGPNSFTGEDVVELHCHGGPAIMAAALQELLACGCRAAEPGEFTRRAFLNGRMDLSQAEAVAEAIAAPSRQGLRLAQARLSGSLGEHIRELRDELLELKQLLCLALDFPEEDLEEASPELLRSRLLPVLRSIDGLLSGHERARAWREGVLAVLAGQVNAGKSSLLNALLGFERAIVTPAPGTTRDYLEETLLLDGLPVRIADTAGLRESGDIVEREGVARSRDLASQADIVLLVHDAALPLQQEERELLASLPPQRVLALCNKDDTVSGEPECLAAFRELGVDVVRVSAASGAGLEELARQVRQRLAETPAADELAPNLRQSQALRLARQELEAMLADLDQGALFDLLDVRLEEALRQLAGVTGEICPDEVLDTIFQQFCIGK